MSCRRLRSKKQECNFSPRDKNARAGQQPGSRRPLGDDPCEKGAACARRISNGTSHRRMQRRFDRLTDHLLQSTQPPHPQPSAMAAAAAAAAATVAPAPGSASVLRVALSNGVEMPAMAFGCVKAKETVAAALVAGYTHLDTAHVYRGSSGTAGGSEEDIGELHREGAWQRAGARDATFITTKTSSHSLNSYMWNVDEDATAGVLAEFDGCLRRLGVDCVDCLLLHWPGPPRAGREGLPNTLSADQHAKKRLAMCALLFVPLLSSLRRALDRRVIGMTRWSHAETFHLPLLVVGEGRGLEQIYAKGNARSIGVSNFTVDHLERMLPFASVRPMVNQIECHTRCAQRALVE
jgi:diketogulonate reductase-like aldo/keto reductase